MLSIIKAKVYFDTEYRESDEDDVLFKNYSALLPSISRRKRPHNGHAARHIPTETIINQTASVLNTMIENGTLHAPLDTR